MCGGQGREAVMKSLVCDVSINELPSLSGDRRRKRSKTYQLPRGGSGGHHLEFNPFSARGLSWSCVSRLCRSSSKPKGMYKELDEERGELCSLVVVWQKAAEKKLLARARLL